MTAAYVFDTEAIIAFLYEEPGHRRVADLLRQVFAGDVQGSIAESNAGEVFYLVSRFEGRDGVPTDDSLRIADRDVRSLERRGLDVRPAEWRSAAEIKAHGGLSFADAHAVALADELRATLVAGGDDDFENLPTDVEVVHFRSGSV